MSGDAGLMPSVEQDPIWDKEALTLIVGDNPTLHQRLMDKFLLNAKEIISEISTLERRVKPRAVQKLLIN